MAFTRNHTKDEDVADADDETKNKWLPLVLFPMVDYAVSMHLSKSTPYDQKFAKYYDFVHLH